LVVAARSSIDLRLWHKPQIACMLARSFDPPCASGLM